MHPQSSSRKAGTSSQFREVEDAITKQSVISPPGAAGEDWCEKYQKRWASARQWASRKPTVGLDPSCWKKWRKISSSVVVVDRVLPNEKKIVGTDMCSKI